MSLTVFTVNVTAIQNCLANSTVNDKCPHNTNWATSKMTSSILIIFLDIMKDKLCQRSVPTDYFSNNVWSNHRSHNLIIMYYITMILYTFQSISHWLSYLNLNILAIWYWHIKSSFTWPKPATCLHISYQLPTNFILSNVCFLLPILTIFFEDYEENMACGLLKKKIHFLKELFIHLTCFPFSLIIYQYLHVCQLRALLPPSRYAFFSNYSIINLNFVLILKSAL